MATYRKKHEKTTMLQNPREVIESSRLVFHWYLRFPMDQIESRSVAHFLFEPIKNERMQ